MLCVTSRNASKVCCMHAASRLGWTMSNTSPRDSRLRQLSAALSTEVMLLCIEIKNPDFLSGGGFLVRKGSLVAKHPLAFCTMDDPSAAITPLSDTEVWDVALQPHDIEVSEVSSQDFKPTTAKATPAGTWSLWVLADEGEAFGQGPLEPLACDAFLRKNVVPSQRGLLSPSTLLAFTKSKEGPAVKIVFLPNMVPVTAP